MRRTEEGRTFIGWYNAFMDSEVKYTVFVMQSEANPKEVYVAQTTKDPKDVVVTLPIY
jgi:hypothetical protein